MNELSLFSGAGGGLLGSKLLGWRCIGYVEKDKYCQKVLRQRIKDGILDNAPIYSSIEAFIGKGFAGIYEEMVDILTAGFPCQPFSVAGKRKGEMDKRNMWPATIETIRIVRPRFCLLENVPGLLTHEYFGTILRELSESGYDARWKVISAAEMGAPHWRNRLWILATNSNGKRWNAEINQKDIHDDRRGSISNPWSEIADWRNSRPKGLLLDCFEKATDAGFIGIHDGLAADVDRLKAIGNGQVPAVVNKAWEILIGE